MDRQSHRLRSPLLAYASGIAHQQQQTDLLKQNLQCTLALIISTVEQDGLKAMERRACKVLPPLLSAQERGMSIA